MIDFPITDLLDASICMIWLERHLHPYGYPFALGLMALIALGLIGFFRWRKWL
jgi:Mg2+ and Co2+ transporter CorA